MSADNHESSSWRILAVNESPKWHGDLDDDCTALWAGFMLRAEKMDHALWWWCGYDGADVEPIASSNDSEQVWVTGTDARDAAEQAARRWLGLPSAR